jgi:hypothetical protein
MCPQHFRSATFHAERQWGGSPVGVWSHRALAGIYLSANRLNLLELETPGSTRGEHVMSRSGVDKHSNLRLAPFRVCILAEPGILAAVWYCVAGWRFGVDYIVRQTWRARFALEAAPLGSESRSGRNGEGERQGDPERLSGSLGSRVVAPLCS